MGLEAAKVRLTERQRQYVLSIANHGTPGTVVFSRAFLVDDECLSDSHNRNDEYQPEDGGENITSSHRRAAHILTQLVLGVAA
jgi:hypothetical protein